MSCLRAALRSARALPCLLPTASWHVTLPRIATPVHARLFSSSAPASSSTSSFVSDAVSQKHLDAAAAAVDRELAGMSAEDVQRYKARVLGITEAEAEAVESADDQGAPISPEVDALLQRLQANKQAANDAAAFSIPERASAAERAWLEQLRLDVESLRRFGVAPRTGRGVRVEAGEVYFTFKAFDKTLLRQFTERLAQKALALQLDCFSVVPLPTRIRRWTVLSSPFVDKEARSQFEMRVHKRLVVVQTRALERRLDPSRFDHWAAQARIHRMIEVFMRFMPGIQVTFHHKIIRRV